jgi:hypothetical protein
MADDDKIVTKKTAAKPAATTKKAPARAEVPARKTAVRKAPVAPAPAALAPRAPAVRPAAPPPAAVKPAAPAPAALKPAAPAPRPAAPAPMPAAPAPMPRPAPPATKVAGKKEQAKAPGQAPTRAAATQAPLEEKPVALAGLANVTPARRLAMIRDAAYFRAERRGFAPGNDADDWAAAEREIDELLAKGGPGAA